MLLDAVAARDWLGRLRGGWEAVREVLDEAEADEAWRDPDVGAEVLAAGELIAAGRGRPSRVLPSAAEAFLDRVDGWPSTDDAARVAGLVAAVRDGGSLAAEDHAGDDAWRAAVDDLLARLRW